MQRRHLILGAGATLAVTRVAAQRSFAQEASPEATGGAVTFPLPGDAVYPEGIVYDAPTNAFFTGSTGDGTIFRGDLTSGEVTVLAPPDAARPFAAGLDIDSSGRLFVAGGGTNLVTVLNSTSGIQIAQFRGAFEETFLNDLAVAPNGDVYITDSLNPVLYRIAAENIEIGGDLEQFVDFTGTPFEYGVPGSFNANGIVITDDGAFAIVVNAGMGQLFRIDLASGEVAEIAIVGEPVLNGDGLALDGDHIYVLRNAVALIVRLELDPGLTTATEVDAFTDASLAFPTTLALVGSTQALVVNSQFDRRSTGDPVLPFNVSLIDLPPLPGLPVASPEATPLA